MQGVSHIEVTLIGPAKAFPTQLDARATAYPYRSDVGGVHSPANAYDGFRLSPNPQGTMTGTVTVYGYRK